MLMFVTMVIAGLVVDLLFSGLGLTPTGPRPTRADIFGSVSVNCKLVLNVLGLVIFSALFALTARRGGADPVCEMTVDRDKAITRQLDKHTHYFSRPPLTTAGPFAAGKLIALTDKNMT
ncbi:MAG: hypothetical protein ACR2NR_07510 [Solirubrobacteraceae bacterium]